MGGQEVLGQLLFERFVSVVVETTLARFSASEEGPGCVTVTLIVTWAKPGAETEPRLAVAEALAEPPGVPTLGPLQVPPVTTTQERKVVPMGQASVSVTPAAVFGPLLVMVS